MKSALIIVAVNVGAVVDMRLLLAAWTAVTVAAIRLLWRHW